MSGGGTTPPAAGSGGSPAACATAPCPLITCPTVEIEINNTPDVKDDVVALKCIHPAGRVTVKCRIRATGSPTVNATMILTNPDGRLRFPGAHDKTHTLTIPKTGAWVPFMISGEKGSDAIGDAVIEAHCHTTTGELKGSKPVTVFWFDQAQINLTAPGTYSIAGGRFTASGGSAVKHSAQARLRPAGVDCTIPQIVNLRVGIMQNALAGVRSTDTWNNPTIAWNAGTVAGKTVKVPKEMRTTIRRPSKANDSEASVAPLYDQPGKSGTLDPDSLKPPMGCTGGAAATSQDTPSNGIPGNLVLPAKTAAGVTVGSISYSFRNTTISISFFSWVVIFETVHSKFCALRQRGWSINVDSAAAGTQKVSVDAADAKPTNPVIAPPFSNAIVNNPKNHHTGAVDPSQTTTFTSP